jgi:hypothetical protein
MYIVDIRATPRTTIKLVLLIAGQLRHFKQTCHAINIFSSECSRLVKMIESVVAA